MEKKSSYQNVSSKYGTYNKHYYLREVEYSCSEVQKLAVGILLTAVEIPNRSGAREKSQERPKQLCHC